VVGVAQLEGRDIDYIYAVKVRRVKSKDLAQRPVTSRISLASPHSFTTGFFFTVITRDDSTENVLS